jgi:hypothetical protein
MALGLDPEAERVLRHSNLGRHAKIGLEGGRSLEEKKSTCIIARPSKGNPLLDERIGIWVGGRQQEKGEDDPEIHCAPFATRR